VLLFLFCYFSFLNKIGSQLACVGERHAPLFHVNTCSSFYFLVFMAKAESLSTYMFMFMGKAESRSIYLLIIWLETENASCGSWYIVLNNLMLGNCFELSSRSCLSSCIM